MTRNEQLETIDSLLAQLKTLEPLPAAQIKNLEDFYKVELTYTSNAIEGNTLTRAETAQVVEKGLTIEGKQLSEHLEAINHAEALDYVRELTDKKRSQLTQTDLLNIHRLILQRIDDTNAGKYRTAAVRIAGSDVILPNPLKIPELMDGFFEWLTTTTETHPAKIAVDAHFKLVSIHPFTDGNGRTARLLMNLLLMQVGFSPTVIRNEARSEYIGSIEYGQKTQDLGRYHDFMYGEIERSLTSYLKLVKPNDSNGDEAEMGTEDDLLRIGELAKQADETVVTIRHWTREGLLPVKKYTESQYALYEPIMVERAREIRRLQDKLRLTLAEIKERLEAANG